MRAFFELLKRHLWAAFLIHQLAIFALAAGFLSLVRKLSGRNIHLGAEPVGWLDGIALIALSIAVIYLTRIFYRYLEDETSASLGIAFSTRRLLELIAGLIIGFAFVIAPWMNAISRNTAAVTDRIDAHFDVLSIARILFVAFLLLLIQGITEETANRAFPMRLWEHRTILFRLFVPALFFALIHLADENFSFERITVLIMAGVLQGIAYLLTGNIWFSSGLHTGANLAGFSITGLWHAGAIVRLSGYSNVPNWLMILLLLILLNAALILKEKKFNRQTTRNNAK